MPAGGRPRSTAARGPGPRSEPDDVGSRAQARPAYEAGPPLELAGVNPDPELADVDGDGDLDQIVRLAQRDAFAQVLLNDGRGRFVAGAQVPDIYNPIVAPDVDGDAAACADDGHAVTEPDEQNCWTEYAARIRVDPA